MQFSIISSSEPGIRIRLFILGNSMPAKTKKQERFMQAVAHSSKFAKKVGVPMKVGKEMTKTKRKKK